jgi:hypothetical protein
VDLALANRQFKAVQRANRSEVLRQTADFDRGLVVAVN